MAMPLSHNRFPLLDTFHRYAAVVETSTCTIPSSGLITDSSGSQRTGASWNSVRPPFGRTPLEYSIELLMRFLLHQS